jgi:AraC family transcriptional regulator of adaptative response / DNA-3-methyladenine glycosylase II
VFATTPSELRRRAKHHERAEGAYSTLTLRLPFRQPLCPDNLFGHLAATSVPGIEEVRDGEYRRTLRLDHGPGIVGLAPTSEYVRCRLTLTDLRDLTTAIARSRWLLDLDADPVAIDDRLAHDPRLRALITKAPGRRVPRCVDGDELAIRAVIGQQISTAAARTATARIVTRRGEPVRDDVGGLTHLFPTAEALQRARFAMPAARAHTMRSLVRALRSGALDLGPGADRARAIETLSTLPGFGPWTTQVVAMRALGDPDAFPVTDLGVRRAARALGLGSARALVEHAAAWQPWRAYAVQYLWSTTDHAVNRWPIESQPTLQEAS